MECLTICYSVREMACVDYLFCQVPTECYKNANHGFFLKHKFLEGKMIYATPRQKPIH